MIVNSLDRENSLVLQTLQASHGLVSPTMNAIAIQVEIDKVVLHFLVAQDSSEVEEDIEDMIFELDALLGGSLRIEARVCVGRSAADWPGQRWRLIYLAKPTATGRS